MNTKFFFTLPVVAMFAMTMTTTVANAKGCKDEVNKVVRVEATSVNNVDAKAYAKVAAFGSPCAEVDAKLAARLFPTYSGMDVDAKVDGRLAKRAGSGYDAAFDAESDLLAGWLDSGKPDDAVNKVDTKLAKRVRGWVDVKPIAQLFTRRGHTVR